MMSYITRSRKYPYHTMDSFFGILKASYNWKSKEMGGYFMIGIFKRCGGGGGGGGVCYIVDLEFPRGQLRVYSLKTLILWP